MTNLDEIGIKKFASKMLKQAISDASIGDDSARDWLKVSPMAREMLALIGLRVERIDIAILNYQKLGRSKNGRLREKSTTKYFE